MSSSYPRKSLGGSSSKITSLPWRCDLRSYYRDFAFQSHDDPRYVSSCTITASCVLARHRKVIAPRIVSDISSLEFDDVFTRSPYYTLWGEAPGENAYKQLSAILQSPSVCVQVLWFCSPLFYFIFVFVLLCLVFTVLCSALLLDARFCVHFFLGSPDISFFISTDLDRNQLLWPFCNQDLPAVASI